MTCEEMCPKRVFRHSDVSIRKDSHWKVERYSSLRKELEVAAPMCVALAPRKVQRESLYDSGTRVEKSAPATVIRGYGPRCPVAMNESTVFSSSRAATAQNKGYASLNPISGEGKSGAHAPASSATISARCPVLVRKNGPSASSEIAVFFEDRRRASSHAPGKPGAACVFKTCGKRGLIGGGGRPSLAPEVHGRKRAIRLISEEPSIQPFKKKPFNPRQAVRERLGMFRDLAREMQHNGMAKPDLEALKVLKQLGRVPVIKYPGDVPGVEVGDEFHYRVELMVAGLHSSHIVGIDTMPFNGRKIATCVISSKRYDNLMEGSDVLVYCGEGGNMCGFGSSKQQQPAGDQTLERGNLALKNSMELQTPVRVVHGFSVPRVGGEALESRSNTVVKYVYDGLYLVQDFWWVTGSTGRRMLKFQMRRMPGQRELNLKLIRRSRDAKKSTTMTVQCGGASRAIVGDPATRKI